MNKTAVSALPFLLLFSAGPVQAQFAKNPVRAAVNYARLHRVITQTARRPGQVVSSAAMRVPNAIVSSGWIELKPVVPFNQVQTPAAIGYNEYIRHMQARTMQEYGFAEEIHDYAKRIVPAEWEKAGGRAFYTSQAVLAKDLHAFYRKHQPSVYVGPDGHDVYLYALPVENILYKPEGYTKPVVLDPKSYFVIYDIKTHTGKIASNIPGIYNLYKKHTVTPKNVKQVSPAVKELGEIWTAMGVVTEYRDLNALCYNVLAAHLHQARIDRASHPADAAQIKQWVDQGKKEVDATLKDQDALLSFLERFPQARQAPLYKKVYILDLPAEELVWVRLDGTRHVFNAADHAVVFWEWGTAGVVPRVDLQNPAFFLPVEQ